MQLRSYSYNFQYQLTPEILNLFDHLVKNPSYKCTCCSEIIDNALDGRINLKDFNLPAYEITVKKNQRLLQSTKNSKLLSLDYENEDSDDSCNLHNLLASDEDITSEVENDEMYKYSFNWLISSNNKVLIESGVDLIYCLVQSLRGIPQAVETLKEVMTSNEDVREHIYIVLNHGIEKDLIKYMEVSCNG